jgi:hypothetical protein
VDTVTLPAGVDEGGAVLDPAVDDAVTEVPALFPEHATRTTNEPTTSRCTGIDRRIRGRYLHLVRRA